jgi:hypothetical protein
MLLIAAMKRSPSRVGSAIAMDESYNVNKALKYDAYVRVYSHQSLIAEELGEMSALEVRFFEQAYAVTAKAKS